MRRYSLAPSPATGMYCGMTLVELMIVTSIILMLVVISVPVVKPMLESRKQADAAQTLSIYLNSARIRASETGRECGVLFERYTDNNRMEGPDVLYPYNDTCLIARQVETPPVYTGSVGVLVSVEPIYEVNDKNGNLFDNYNGQVANIVFHKWDSVNRVWSRSPKKPSQPNDLRTVCYDENPYWNNLVRRGDRIQFDGQGPFYTIVQEGSYPDQVEGNRTRDNAYFNKNPAVQPDLRCPMIAVRGRVEGGKDMFDIRRIPETAPVPFKVIRAPQPTLAPPIGFPTGIIVDLQYSGIDSFGTRNASADGHFLWSGVGSDFRPRSGADRESVIVMFSPSGSVSLVRGDYVLDKDGPIHFLLGRWDRAAGEWSQDENKSWTVRADMSPYPPDDELRNFQDLSNMWVTVDQYTGRVTTNPMAPSDSDSAENPLKTVNARAYASKPK